MRISAPAVDDKANKAIMKYLSRRLGLKNRQVSLKSGHASRRKTFLIESENEPSWGAITPDGLVLTQ